MVGRTVARDWLPDSDWRNSSARKSREFQKCVAAATSHAVLPLPETQHILYVEGESPSDEGTRLFPPLRELTLKLKLK